VVVGGHDTKSGEKKRILGTGLTASKGLRYGYIVGTEDATRSIEQAVAQAEDASGIRVKSARLSVGGVSLEGTQTTGSVVISRGDSEITSLDVEKVLDAAERALPESASQNRRVLHIVPVEYKIDGKELLGNRPIGMKGVKLDVHATAITCLSQHLDDLIRAVEEAGVEVEDVIAEPIAASMVNLTKTQRIAGVALLDIGAETTSMVVYEDNVPISLKIFPIGSTDITNDIALGLKIPLDEAEQVKLAPDQYAAYSKKDLNTIITARLSDILELVESHLKKIKKNGLLPAGIVITGGGSGVASIDDLARAALKLPSQKAELSIATSKGVIRDPSWSVAYGLCVLGLASPSDVPSGLDVARRTKDTLSSWISKFLP